MCDHAFAWAKQNGLWQINPVHKEEEASLVIERLFNVAEQDGEEMQQNGSFETQDPLLGPNNKCKKNMLHMELSNLQTSMEYRSHN